MLDWSRSDPVALDHPVAHQLALGVPVVRAEWPKQEAQSG